MQRLHQATNLLLQTLGFMAQKLVSEHRRRYLQKICASVIKGHGTNMLNLQPPQLSPQIRTFVTTRIILVPAVYSYDLL